ncbi:MAG TPA: class II aldolase/adducin family protein [Bryobacteraceae bacterium]|nr:class II aldolase/adducin family protein [Bryobacteraceae bacterium]
MPDLAPLRRLSARIGRNLDLVQAGGGNTSLKEGDTLWVKASGMWLVDAEKEDMFLPVQMRDILRCVDESIDYVADYGSSAGGNTGALRPSVETAMHAVLPHPVVVHVHSVNAIAWAVRLDAPACLEKTLAGLRWAWIPYVHPGLILAQRIRDLLPQRPDVLILGNHGLVIGAEDCDSAQALLDEVELRLALPPRGTPAAKPRALPEVAGWQPAQYEEAHTLAMDAFSIRAAAGGTMYPDHCVYLGPSVAVATPEESPENTVKRYESQQGVLPKVLVIPGKGVLIPTDLPRAGRELLICLQRVTERIDKQAPFGYLDAAEVARLMNWDAEKYRIQLARQYDAQA